MNWVKDIGLLVAGALLGAVLSYLFGYKDTQTQLRMLKEQRPMLESLLKQVAMTDHNLHLIFDAQGHVIGGHVGVGQATETNDTSRGQGTVQRKPQP